MGSSPSLPPSGPDRQKKKENHEERHGHSPAPRLRFSRRRWLFFFFSCGVHTSLSPAPLPLCAHSLYTGADAHLPGKAPSRPLPGSPMQVVLGIEYRYLAALCGVTELGRAVPASEAWALVTALPSGDCPLHVCQRRRVDFFPGTLTSSEVGSQ